MKDIRKKNRRWGFVAATALAVGLAAGSVTSFAADKALAPSADEKQVKLKEELKEEASR